MVLSLRCKDREFPRNFDVVPCTDQDVRHWQVCSHQHQVASLKFGDKLSGTKNLHSMLRLFYKIVGIRGQKCQRMLSVQRKIRTYFFSIVLVNELHLRI